MRIPKHIKNILFDLDDVLVLTRVLDRKVKESVFATLDLQWPQILPYTDLAIKEMLPKMFQDYNITEDPVKYADIYFREYDKRLAYSIKNNIVPGAMELLKKLSKKNYRLAAVTNNTQKQAEIIYRGLELGRFFEVLVTAEDVTHPKPHPEIYQKAIEKLGAKPAECLVIENFPIGIASAKAVSPKIIVVAITTTNSEEDLRKADFIIDSLTQIEIGE